MPRLARARLERGCFHVLNRGNHRQRLFDRDAEYAQFLELLAEGQARHEIALWGYCLMPNHWHLVVEVAEIARLSRCLHGICQRHARLYYASRRDLGGGRLYQGRFKSFPIQDEVYRYQVLRYVAANPLRARLVTLGRDWAWSSLSTAEIKSDLLPMSRPTLQPWPRTEAWRAEVDRPQEDGQLDAMRQSIARGTPLGDPAWVAASPQNGGWRPPCGLVADRVC